MLRKLIKPALTLIILGVTSANLLAYMHARAMMTFTDESSRTASPEQLDFASKTKVLLTGVKIPRPDNNHSPQHASLAYEQHYFSGAKGNRLEAWHIPAEKNEILVLLFHGYSSSKASLLPIAGQLHEMGLSTMSVDFYGSGGSEGTSTTIGYLESIDVNSAFEYAKQMWPNSRIILYGQSMGGVAILRAIAEHNTTPDAVVIESTYDKMLSTVENRFSTMGLPSTPLAELLVFWGGVQSGFNAFKHNPVTYAKSVQCPTLVIHGDLDPRVTFDQAKAVFNQLAGWKQFSAYPNAGHISAMQSNPMYWQNDLKQLIDQI